MKQPAFWLQVREDYILDNVDSMIQYLRDYRYSPDDDNSDFLTTVNCLDSLLQKSLDRISESTFLAGEPDSEKNYLMIRLFSAAVLAGFKIGRENHDYILAIINLIILDRNHINDDIFHKLWEITLNCIRHRHISKTGFDWGDILTKGNFWIRVFIQKLADYTSFRPGPEEHGSICIENNGTLLLKPDTLLLSDLSLQDLSGQPNGIFASPDALMTVRTKDSETMENVDFYEYFRLGNALIHRLSEFRPTPEKELRNYNAGDPLFVRVNRIAHSEIVAESIDPAYNKVRGKVYLRNGYYPDIDSFYELVHTGDLKAGDILAVEYHEGPFPFNLEKFMEKFYRRKAKTHEARRDSAVYLSTFGQGKQGGTLWITPDGIKVAIHNEKAEKMDPKIYEKMEEAMITREPIRIRFYEKVDAEKEPLRIYGEPDIKNFFSTPDHFTAEEGARQFFSDFLDDCLERCPEYGEEASGIRMTEPGLGIRVLLNLVCHHLTDNSSGSREKIEYIVCARILASICGRTEEQSLLTQMGEYQKALVDFCNCREVKELPRLDEVLEENQYVRRWHETISLLSGYRNPEFKTSAPIDPEKQQARIRENLGKLIEASNSLQGVISETELNNIKRNIARTLGVEEEYTPIISDRTHYGDESITLEFKVSIVFPPANRRRPGSALSDPDLQKWAILKAVCAFLNTRAGGELLLGVNDDGYAAGLSNDINELFRMRLIKKPDMDNYSRYVQNLVEEAFCDFDQEMDISAILGSCIQYVIEHTKEGFDILRLKINPYPFGLVKFRDQDRPEGIALSYVRQSGKSKGMTEGLKALMMTKRFENDTSNSSRLRMAIQDHQIVKLHNYADIDSKKDRLVEVYKYWGLADTLCGYDTEEKKTFFFKISRAEKVEVTVSKWKYASGNQNLDLDPFGMGVDPADCEKVRILLSPYANMILREQYPMSGRMITERSRLADDYRHFSHELTCEISNPEGMARFCIGLAGHLKIKDGPRTRQYLFDKIQATNEKFDVE